MRYQPGDLTRGPIVKKSLAFGTPLALALMGHGLFNIVDLVIVGRLDEGAVAAVTVAGIVLMVAFLLFDGMSNVTVALSAHAHGARQRRMLHDVAWESFGLALIFGLVGGIVFHLLSYSCVGWFEFTDDQAAEDGIAYIQVMAWGLITMFMIMQTTAVLRGVGNSFWPMVIMVGSNILNIVLDILLVFGYLGFPELGVVGAAWATVIARGLGAMLGFWLLWNGTRGVRLKRWKFRRPIRYMRTLVTVGLPTSLQMATRVLVVFFLLKIAQAAYDGETEYLVAGVGICIRLEMVALFLGFGWGAAATTLVGQNLGARRPGRASRGTWIMVIFGTVSMSMVGVLLWVFREDVIYLIMPSLNPAAMAAADEYLRITIPFYPVLAVAVVLSRALNGATSTLTPMVIDMAISFGLTLPLALWLTGVGFFEVGASSPMEISGAWWAAAISYAASGLIFVVVFAKGAWRHKTVSPPPLEAPGGGKD